MTKNVDNSSYAAVQQLCTDVANGKVTADEMAMIVAGDKNLAFAAAKDEYILTMRFYNDYNPEYGGNDGYPMAWAVAYDADAAKDMMLNKPDVLRQRCGKDMEGATVWHLIAREHSTLLLEVLSGMNTPEEVLKLDGLRADGKRMTVAEELISNSIDCIDEVLVFLVGLPKLLEDVPRIKKSIAEVFGDKLGLLSSDMWRTAQTASQDELKLVLEMYTKLREISGIWEKRASEDSNTDHDL